MSSHQEIAELAYRLWEARGRPEGSHDEDRLAAERQLGISNGSSGPAAPVTSSSLGSQGQIDAPADQGTELES